MKEMNVGVLGATGAVGQEMLRKELSLTPSP